MKTLLIALLLCSPVWAQDRYVDKNFSYEVRHTGRYYDDLLFNHTTTTIRTTAEMPVEPIVGWPTKVEWFPDTTTTSIDSQLYFTDEEWERVEGALTTTTTTVPDNSTIFLVVGSCYIVTATDINRMTDHEIEDLARLVATGDKLQGEVGVAFACRLLPHWLTERNRECERQGE